MTAVAIAVATLASTALATRTALSGRSGESAFCVLLALAAILVGAATP